jgi:hypothetical protein
MVVGAEKSPPATDVQLERLKALADSAAAAGLPTVPLDTADLRALLARLAVVEHRLRNKETALRLRRDVAERRAVRLNAAPDA